MNVHKNARLTPHSRAELVRRVLVEGQAPKAVATAFGVSAKTVRKWVERFPPRAPPGLEDRSSRPHRALPANPHGNRRADRARCAASAGPASRSPRQTGVSPATVSRVLGRRGLSRMRDLEPAAPVIRYERKQPGELIHLDIKKLGRFDRVGHRITGDRTGQSNSRGIGWEFVHVCHRRRLARGLQPGHARREERERRRLPEGGLRLLQEPRRHRRPGDDRQRLMLQGVRLPRHLPRS